MYVLRNQSHLCAVQDNIFIVSLLPKLSITMQNFLLPITSLVVNLLKQITNQIWKYKYTCKTNKQYFLTGF